MAERTLATETANAVKAADDAARAAADVKYAAARAAANAADAAAYVIARARAAAARLDVDTAAYAADTAAYAADAADVAADVVFAIHDDLDLIVSMAHEGNWNDDTPVGPDIFGSMWPDGEPDGWPKNDDE